MAPSLPGSASSAIGLAITSEFDGAGLDDAQAQLDTAGKSFQTLGDAADEAASQVTAATDDINAGFVSLGATADDYTANMATISAATDGAVGSITVLGSTADATSDVVIAANDAMMASYGELAATADSTNASIDATSAASGVARGAGAGGLAGAISNPYVAAGAAIAVGGALIVKSSADYQTALEKLYSTAGETANYDQLSNAILGVSEATGTSVSQLSQAQYYISSAGYTALSGVDILNAAAEGAKEEGANVTDVANALTTAMNDYGASAPQANSYMNQMLTIVSQAKTTLEDLSPALSKVLQPAAAVGLSLANVGAGIDALTSKGIDAEQATQDVEALIKELSGASVTTSEINNLQQYGLNITTIEQNLGKEGLGGTVEEVWDAITQKMGANGLVMQNALQNAQVAVADMNEEIQAAPAAVQNLANELINGQISYAAFRTQSQAMTSEGDRNYLKDIENAYNKTQTFNQSLTAGKPGQQTGLSALSGVFGQSDTLQAVQALISTGMPKLNSEQEKIADSGKKVGKNIQDWTTYTNTTNAQFEITTAKLEGAAITLGEKIMPYATDFLKDVNKILSAVSDIVTAFSKVYEWLGKIGKATGLSELVKLAGGGGGIAKDVLSVIPGFASGITNFGGGLALVGESGPELVYLPQGSSVMPSTETGSMMSSSTTSQNTTNNSHQVTIGQVNLSTSAAVSAFITQLDLDNIAVGKGLTASRGIS